LVAFDHAPAGLKPRANNSQNAAVDGPVWPGTLLRLSLRFERQLEPRAVTMSSMA
jgi:hypothetical protein